jgi:hypothetical protein
MQDCTSANCKHGKDVIPPKGSGAVQEAAGPAQAFETTSRRTAADAALRSAILMQDAAAAGEAGLLRTKACTLSYIGTIQIVYADSAQA